VLEGLSTDYGIVMFAIAVEANLNLGIGGMEDRQQYVGHSYAVGCELYFAAYCIHMLQKCWETRMNRRLTTTKMDSLHSM
jgi:hypothetical protein